MIKFLKKIWQRCKDAFGGNSSVEPIEHHYNENKYFHRTNGPAILWTDGDYLWCINGRRHRYYGPALKWASSYWYINGARIK